MNGLEISVLLGATVLVGGVLAPRIRVATPLLLLAAGILLGFVPELREIHPGALDGAHDLRGPTQELEPDRVRHELERWSR